MKPEQHIGVARTCVEVAQRALEGNLPSVVERELARAQVQLAAALREIHEPIGSEHRWEAEPRLRGSAS